jgi:hypothetical protein
MINRIFKKMMKETDLVLSGLRLVLPFLYRSTPKHVHYKEQLFNVVYGSNRCSCTTYKYSLCPKWRLLNIQPGDTQIKHWVLKD